MWDEWSRSLYGRVQVFRNRPIQGIVGMQGRASSKMKQTKRRDIRSYKVVQAGRILGRLVFAHLGGFATGYILKGFIICLLLASCAASTGWSQADVGGAGSKTTMEQQLKQLGSLEQVNVVGAPRLKMGPRAQLGQAETAKAGSTALHLSDESFTKATQLCFVSGVGWVEVQSAFAGTSIGMGDPMARGGGNAGAIVLKANPVVGESASENALQLGARKPAMDGCAGRTQNSISIGLPTGNAQMKSSQQFVSADQNSQAFFPGKFVANSTSRATLAHVRMVLQSNVSNSTRIPDQIGSNLSGGNAIAITSHAYARSIQLRRKIRSAGDLQTKLELQSQKRKLDEKPGLQKTNSAKIHLKTSEMKRRHQRTLNDRIDRHR